MKNLIVFITGLLTVNGANTIFSEFVRRNTPEKLNRLQRISVAVATFMFGGMVAAFAKKTAEDTISEIEELANKF